MKQLIRRKPMHKLLNEAVDEHGLKRVLSATNLVALGIGAIIGTGIFVITGTVAANHAGPALALSFLLSGIGCVFAGLCYAEFAAMIPISGSAYTYAYATLGEFIAWIIGWDLILEYLFASSTVAVGWSGYVVSFLTLFNLHLPENITNAPFAYGNDGHWMFTGSIINLPAVFIIALITILLVIGIRESVKFNNGIVIIKLLVIFLFIGFGLSFVDTSNWVPFIPENTGKFGEYGWSGILTGAGIIFFAFIGFDAISTAAQEAKNPSRDMPIGILVSLLICTILYIIVSMVLTGMVPYQKLDVPAPIALAINSTGNSLAWLSPWINIGAIAGLSSVILVMLMGQPRIFFSMAKDGLLPSIFTRVHSTFKTPYITTIITGSFAALLAGLFPIKVLSEMVSIGTLFAFVIVCVSIPILRYKHPEVPRPFKTPFNPVIPILGALICFAQMLALPGGTWKRLIIWMFIGVVIYFIYGKKNSKNKSHYHI